LSASCSCLIEAQAHQRILSAVCSAGGQSFELRSTECLLTCHSLACDSRSRARGCWHMPLCTYIGRSSTNTYTRAHSSPLSPALVSRPRSIDCSRRHMSTLFSLPLTRFILIPVDPNIEKSAGSRRCRIKELTAVFRTRVRHTPYK